MPISANGWVALKRTHPERKARTIPKGDELVQRQISSLSLSLQTPQI